MPTIQSAREQEWYWVSKVVEIDTLRFMAAADTGTWLGSCTRHDFPPVGEALRPTKQQPEEGKEFISPCSCQISMKESQGSSPETGTAAEAKEHSH